MKEKYVIFSLINAQAFGKVEQYMFSNLHYLQQKGYSVVLATNNDTVKQNILSQLSSREKKSFHIVTAPYQLDAVTTWKGLVKFFFILPSALIWCDTMIKHLKKDYKEVICLWSGVSDRLVFSPLAKRHNCPLVWVENGPLALTCKKLFGFPRLLYRFAERYPDHVITTSLSTKESILRNTRFREKDITLVYPNADMKARSKKTFTKMTKFSKSKDQKGIFSVITLFGQ